MILQEGLREYKWVEYNLEKELEKMECQPLLTISKDFWVPASQEIMELEAETNATRKGYLERCMMAAWAARQVECNAEIQANNDAVKKEHEEIITKGNKAARKDTIKSLMGKFLGNMAAESRQMVMKWQRTYAKDPTDPESDLKADNIKEAYQKYDWIFGFEATMVTYLHADCTVDATAILE